MKKIILLICLLNTGYVEAQNADTIPNGGFESWIFGGWGMNPRFWDTNNSQLFPPTVVTDSDSYSGDIAMKLLNGGVLRPYAGCSLIITHHPLALEGYIKNQLINNDSAILQLHLYQNHVHVDSGYQVIYAGINPNYTSFSVPVTQNSAFADSCAITFLGGTVYQSSITFDDLFFTFPSAIDEMESSFLFSAGPNPVRDILLIHLQGDNRTEPATATMYDITGKKTCEKIFLLTEIINEISLKGLAKGIYLLCVEQNNKTGTQMIIKD